LLPESLLDDNSGTATALVTLVFLVRSVAILNDGRRLTTSTVSLLRVVTAELTLDQNGCLRHSLVVHELPHTVQQPSERF